MHTESPDLFGDLPVFTLPTARIISKHVKYFYSLVVSSISVE